MEIDDKVKEILGSTICNVLDLLGIAADEAERAGVLSSMPSEMFMMLKPSSIFEHTHDDCYRSHVRELIQRFKTDKQLDLATSAEVLLGMVHVSQVAPLNQGGSALYHELFRRVMGVEQYEALLGDTSPPRETYPGEVAELELDARRKVRVGRPVKLQAVQPQLSLLDL